MTARTCPSPQLRRRRRRRHRHRTHCNNQPAALCLPARLPACPTAHAGDAVAIFNFRADRVIEISKAFEYSEFNAFDRKRWPQTRFVGMMQVGRSFVF